MSIVDLILIAVSFLNRKIPLSDKDCPKLDPRDKIDENSVEEVVTIASRLYRPQYWRDDMGTQSKAISTALSS